MRFEYDNAWMDGSLFLGNCFPWSLVASCPWGHFFFFFGCGVAVASLYFWDYLIFLINGSFFTGEGNGDDVIVCLAFIW